EAGGLQEQACMPDKGDAPGFVADLGGRPVAVGTGPSVGPVGSRSGQPPADQIDDAARLCAVGIEETRAVEMIRYRAVVVARHRSSSENPKECGGGEGTERSNDPAARSGHPQSRSSWALWRGRARSEREARPAAAGSLGVGIIDAE